MSKFGDIFRDDNKWNEKSIIGFISFAIMILYIIVYAISGALGWGVVIEPLIFNSLVTITLGSFGIAEVSKTAERWQRGRQHKPPMERERDVNDNPEEVDDYHDTES